MTALSEQKPSSSCIQDDLESCENRRDYLGNKQYQGKWFHYEHCVSIASSDVHVNPVVKHLTETTSLEDMMGFDNTGNVCVWPAEEILAFYCLRMLKCLRAKLCES